MNDQLQIQRQKSPASGFLVYSIVILIALSFAAIQPLIPNDFFPYLRIGQEIIRTGHIPTTEFMTYTGFGQPALYLYWLPSLIFLGIYQLGGITLTSLVALICVGLLFTLLWAGLRELKISSLVSGLILVMITLIAASYFNPRPQVLSFPLFGLSLWLILRWQNGKNRYLWLLPLIAMLWANIHGSFIVLFFMLIPAALVGSGDRKRLLILTGISFLATFINIYTYHIWANMFSVVANSSNQKFGIEWKPLSNQGWQANIFFALLLLTPLLAAVQKNKIKWLFWIWFVGFGWMAVSSIRYVIWFLPIAAIVLCQLIDPYIAERNPRSVHFQNRTMNLILGSFLLLFPLTLLPGIRATWWQKAPPAYDLSTPIQAAEWLSANPQLPDHLWADFSFSTYLTYALPQRQLFSSNRIEDLTTSQIEDYFYLANARYDWQAVMDKYNINLVMPSVVEQPGLIEALSASQDWKQVYGDEQAVIFVRKP
jgi:hypothetical protein